MTELLGKIFIRDRDNTRSPAVRRAWGTLVAIVGIITNLLLFVGKLTVGTLFGAISISADAVNNLSDAGSQLISLVSFRLSAKPADREHPFGHARVEYVASMIVSFIVLLIGFDLFRDAFAKIFSSERAEFSWLSAAVLTASVLAKLWLAAFNRKVGSRIDSSVMKATATDSLTDALATSAVLVSQFILLASGFDADGYLGILVSAFIMWSGVKILRDTMNSLIGGAPDTELTSEITRIVDSHSGVLGIHDMVVHNYGPGRSVVSLHVEVDGAVDIFLSHDLVDTIEKELQTELGIAATIHLDPIVTNDGETEVLRICTAEAVRNVDERLQIHDFRFVKGVSHSNLIFDVCAPFELKLGDEELRREINAKIKEIDPSFETVITVDRT